MKMYQYEKRNWTIYIMPIIGIIMMIGFTILKIVTPDNWAPGGYAIAMIFMIVWTGGSSAFTYLMDIKPRKALKRLKEECNQNALKLNGKIVNYESEIIGYVNGTPKFRYIVEVKVDGEEKTIKSLPLTMNPELFESDDVTVYKDNEKYFITDFRIEENVAKTKRKRKSAESYTKYQKPSLAQNIVYILASTMIIFPSIMGFIKAGDIVTRLVMIPFAVAGIGALMQGLLPLVFPNLIKYTKDIGLKIYLIGFLLFWFGFLIVFDYMAVTTGEIALLLLTIPFWLVGIFAAITGFKKK